MAPAQDPNSVGGGAKRDEATLKVSSKDPKKKDDKKEEDLSEEDLQLKQNLELYVERVQDPNPELQKAALESMRQDIRASTSSMTSVPKPLKFLRPHYGTLKEFHVKMAESDLKKMLADILSVLALTMSAEGKRESLNYRLTGSEGDIGSWGHEYVRNLAGEIAVEYTMRQGEESSIDDLMLLVRQIVAFHMKHNAETEAVDLLMDVEDLDLLLEHVDRTNFRRTCNYLTSAAKYLPGPDDMLVLDIAYMIYMKFLEFPNALQIALFLDNMQYVKQVFTSCTDLLKKKQFCYMISRHGITFVLDSEMVENVDDREMLQDIVNNTKLSEGYLTLARDIEVMEAKSPEDVYKAHLLDGRASSGPSVDSARQNLAATFVNAFVNAGFGQDKLMTVPSDSTQGSSESWINNLTLIMKLSEEDLQLKQNLELYVERVQYPNPELQKAALESMRQDIHASTSSMTSGRISELGLLRPPEARTHEDIFEQDVVRINYTRTIGTMLNGEFLPIFYHKICALRKEVVTLVDRPLYLGEHGIACWRPNKRAGVCGICVKDSMFRWS